MLAVVADVHLWNHRAHGGPVEGGLNERARLGLRVLRRAVLTAEERGAHVLVIAGDLFDGVRPEPQLVAATQEALKAEEMAVVVLMGNHDLISSSEGDHALGPLAPVATVVTKPTVVQAGSEAVALVPFKSGPAREWFPEQVRALPLPANRKTLALVTHLGLADAATPSFLKQAHDAIDTLEFGKLLAERGIKYGLAGNWHGYARHNYADPGLTVGIQVGALVPTGWDNAGVEGMGSLLLVSSDGVERVEIPGPRFVRSAVEAAAAADAGHAVYLRIKADGEGIPMAQEALAEAIASGEVKAGEVVMDDVEARASARTAATVARSAETLDAALAGYVQTMPLPEGVDAAEVLAKAKGYLGGSRA